MTVTLATLMSGLRVLSVLAYSWAAFPVSNWVLRIPGLVWRSYVLVWMVTVCKGVSSVDYDQYTVSYSVVNMLQYTTGVC